MRKLHPNPISIRYAASYRLHIGVRFADKSRRRATTRAQAQAPDATMPTRFTQLTVEFSNAPRTFGRGAACELEMPALATSAAHRHHHHQEEHHHSVTQ